MSDLRTGLVEAMRDAIDGMGGKRGQQPTPQVAAEAALDAALGFLTDNADQWIIEADRLLGSRVGPDNLASAAEFIAALRDSTGTGETE